MKTLTTTILATLLTVTFANAQVVATSTIACPQITKILSLGARDRAPETQVTELQQYLRSYYRLTDNELLVSGIFGKITRSYVRNFQRDNNLIVSGVVGQPTRAAILARCNGTFAAPAKSASASSSALPISGTQPITNTTNKVSAGGLLSGIRDYASRALNTATPPQKSTQISTTSVTPLQKCSVSGLSMESGSKVKFYLRASADASQGQSCASGSQVRECINGILSGSDAYMTTTCVDVTSAPKSQASNTTAPSNTLDFGGMYGYAVGGVVYTNPATGGASCPSGYTSSPVLGTTGLDYPLYVCTKQTSAGVKPVFDFGGMYGYAVGGVVYTNPATGGASCPSGYVSYPVFGSAGFDFPVYMCYRTSTGVGNSIFNFGGMYGLGNGVEYANPLTGAATCPTGMTKYPFIGTTGTDYPAYFCYSDKVAPNERSCTWGNVTIPHGGRTEAFQTASVQTPASCASETRTCTDGTLSGSYGYASCEVRPAPTPTPTPTPSPTSLPCSIDGISIPSGASRKLYLASNVPTGTSCEEAGMSETRTCTNGLLSGSTSFTKTTCQVNASRDQLRANLKGFIPYMQSTTWSTYYNNQSGTNPPGRGLNLLKSNITEIKSTGFNTLWIGGNHIWMELQPTPGVWDETRVAELKALLAEMQSKNMRAIFQLNYFGISNGASWAPAGIDGCRWHDDPAQVAAFQKFVTELGGKLEDYNYMIYYMVYTEQQRECLLSRGLKYFYRGFDLTPGAPNYGKVSEEAEPYKTYHYTDVHAANAYIKKSLGKFTKTMPKAMRNQMTIGIHDALVADAQILDDAPFDSPNDFDYYSFPFYPTEEEAKYNANPAFLKTRLTDALTRIRSKVGTTVPIMLGEFGWPHVDGYVFRASANSPKRDEMHTAMLEWAKANSVGFNIWMWLPRYIDNPEQETSGYEDSLILKIRDGSSTNLLNVLRSLIGI